MVETTRPTGCRSRWALFIGASHGTLGTAQSAQARLPPMAGLRSPRNNWCKAKHRWHHGVEPARRARNVQSPKSPLDRGTGRGHHRGGAHGRAQRTDIEPCCDQHEHGL
jgi:hypothetical protein